MILVHVGTCELAVKVQQKSEPDPVVFGKVNLTPLFVDPVVWTPLFVSFRDDPGSYARRLDPPHLRRRQSCNSHQLESMFDEWKKVAIVARRKTRARDQRGGRDNAIHTQPA